MQDWTKQESEDAEGVVTFRYGAEPDQPPDVQTIQKQMGIVGWQPGPNRVVQVPSEVRKLNMYTIPVVQDVVGNCRLGLATKSRLLHQQADRGPLHPSQGSYITLA